MDPVTHGILGAMAAQAGENRKIPGKAAIVGALAAMSPDLDMLIHSSADPLLIIEYHRHFTHALAFIPIGALICCLVLYPLLSKRWGIGFASTYLWCLLGYATHGLLDACTSYGTRLWWPFSGTRIAWDIISIIDPLFTLPLLGLLILSCLRNNKLFTYTAIGWAWIYLSLGVIQHHRAIETGKQLAASRNHPITRISAKPSFGNLMVWKVIYETGNKFQVDAVRPGFSDTTVWQGDSVAKLDIARDFHWLDKDSTQARDIERFRIFSADFVSRDITNPYRIVDMRYSMLPQQIQPLWGIAVSPNAAPGQHANFYSERGDSSASLKRLWQMINR